jgi:very-short-patch-repair endonuclease
MQKDKSTPRQRKLFYELKKRGVPAKLELNDGYKTIDIAVPDARVNIEVDGIPHNSFGYQALSDLKRTYYSMKKGYFTLRIPNSLIDHHFEETIDLVVDILNESKAQLEEDFF